MGNLYITILGFVFSFVIYSIARYLDSWSTRKCLSLLDLERHEVNLLVVRLSKKFGLKVALLVTWPVFAVPVAIVDSVIFWKILGAPAIAFLFGFTHILAFMNNMDLYFRAKEFGVDAIEYNSQLIIDDLKKLSIRGKLKYLAKTNFFNTALSVYTTLIVIVLWFSVIMNSQYYLSLGIMMNLGLLMFFPIITFGTILISFRRVKLRGYSKQVIAGQESVTVSIDLLEKAIAEAKLRNAEFISFSLPKGHKK